MTSTTNHFGNPLVTGDVGGSNGSSSSNYFNTHNNSSLQSPTTPKRLQYQFPESPYQLPTVVSPLHVRLSPSTGTSFHSTNNMSKRIPFYVPSGSNSNSSSTSSMLSEEVSQEPLLHHRHRHIRHGKSFSYDSSSSIGVPSMYPGSHHHRRNSFESFLLEELEDFDEIFSSSRSVPPQPPNHHHHLWWCIVTSTETWILFHSLSQPPAYYCTTHYTYPHHPTYIHIYTYK